MGEVRIGGKRVLLAVPPTYMNDSGVAVRALVRRFIRVVGVARFVVVDRDRVGACLRQGQRKDAGLPIGGKIEFDRAQDRFELAFAQEVEKFAVRRKCGRMGAVIGADSGVLVVAR